MYVKQAANMVACFFVGDSDAGFIAACRTNPSYSSVRHRTDLPSAELQYGDIASLK